MIGFLGLSHLGIVSGVGLAAKGLDVLAFDGNPLVVKALAGGDPIVSEPGLAESLASAMPRISWSTQPDDIARCSVVYISADVPTSEAGTSDLAPVADLVEIALDHASSGATIVILSQVPPGTTRSFEAKAEARGCAMVYQVETLIFGSAVERAMRPERFIVGLPAGDTPLPTALREVLERFDCPILPMRYESAELAKIAINTMLVSSIQATDMLAESCELAGADWSEIAPSLRLDRRIGEFAYLTPSLGIGGGNLERDLVTLQTLAAANGVTMPLVDTWRALSPLRREWPYKKLRAELGALGQSTRVAILGLAYKADTDSLRNSPGLALLRSLQGDRATIVWHDPVVVSPPDLEQLRAATIGDALAGADAVVVTTPWREYASLTGPQIADAASGAVVIDPFAVLAGTSIRAAGLRYATLGAGGGA